MFYEKSDVMSDPNPITGAPGPHPILRTGIVLLNAFLTTPLSLLAGLLASATLLIAQNIWIAVGVPIVYGLGNLIRLTMGKKPVKAPIGFFQWALHAAVFTGVLFLPLALMGVGALSAAWFATVAAPWLIQAGAVLVSSATPALGSLTLGTLLSVLLGGISAAASVAFSASTLDSSVPAHASVATAVLAHAKLCFFTTCPFLDKVRDTSGTAPLFADTHDRASSIFEEPDSSTGNKLKLDNNIPDRPFTNVSPYEWLWDTKASNNVFTAARDWHASLKKQGEGFPHVRCGSKTAPNPNIN